MQLQLPFVIFAVQIVVAATAFIAVGLLKLGCQHFAKPFSVPSFVFLEPSELPFATVNSGVAPGDFEATQGVLWPEQPLQPIFGFEPQGYSSFVRIDFLLLVQNES